VILGNSAFSDLVLDSLPTSAYFKLIAPRLSFAGMSLTGLGDMNQDGYDDIILGSIPYQGGYIIQKSYVIFGRAMNTASSASELALETMVEGEDGFTITGGGFLVGKPGDVNEDGVSDILIVSYNSWQNQGNTYFISFPDRVTSPPTFAPSSFPSSFPSAQPTHSPTKSTFVAQPPTNLPSTHSPSSSFSFRTLPPDASLKPTQAPVSTKPTRNPTFRPTTLSPSTKPTFLPSETPTLKPSLLPTVLPTLAPSSLKPTLSPSFRPSRIPSEFPSSYPSESLLKPYNQVSISSNGSYEFPVGKSEIIISGTGNIVIKGNPGTKIYSIVPWENSIVITDFRNNQDIIDLSYFSSTYRSTADITYSINPLIIILSDQQTLTLANHEDFNLTEENFLFSSESTKKKKNPSGAEGITKVIDSTLLIPLVILAVSVLFVVILVYVPSVKSKDGQKNFMEKYLTKGDSKKKKSNKVSPENNNNESEDSDDEDKEDESDEEIDQDTRTYNNNKNKKFRRVRFSDENNNGRSPDRIEDLEEEEFESSWEISDGTLDMDEMFDGEFLDSLEEQEENEEGYGYGEDQVEYTDYYQYGYTQDFDNDDGAREGNGEGGAEYGDYY
jgi:hypothetical protein